MRVTLNGTLRGESGVSQVDIEPPPQATVADALELAVVQDSRTRAVLLDSAGAPRQDLLVFRNGRNVRLQAGLATVLAPNDSLAVFPLTGVQRAFATD